eukprot:scaffold2.g7391.t1
MAQRLAGVIRGVPALPALAVGAAAAQHPSRPQEARSPSRAVVVEPAEDGWSSVVFAAPSREEVRGAVAELVGARVPGGRPAAAGPSIEEIGGCDADSVTSDGSEVNASFMACEAVAPSFVEEAGEEAAPREALNNVIFSLLNNEAVMSVLQAELRRDEHFVAMVQRHSGLPAPAAALMLEDAAGGRRTLRAHPVDAGDPLAELLAGLGQGALRLATAVGLSFARLGNLLRGLAADLLGGLARPARGARGSDEDDGAACAGALEAAVTRAAMAVAVMIFLRRLTPVTI